MKIRLTFKTPDVVFYAINDIEGEEGIQAERAIGKWVKQGEYITVEVDTEKETCTVIPVKDL